MFGRDGSLTDLSFFFRRFLVFLKLTPGMQRKPDTCRTAGERCPCQEGRKLKVQAGKPREQAATPSSCDEVAHEDHVTEK